MGVMLFKKGFKIRNKADAREAAQIMAKAQGEFYFDGMDGFDYLLENKGLYKRSKAERGNIFSPYFEIAKLPDDEQTVWALRKAINKKFFSEKR